MRRRPGLSGQRGQASIEVVGALPLLLIIAAAMWQLLLIGSALSSASNAARTGARTAALDGSKVQAAAIASLREPFRPGAQVQRSGRTVAVSVRVPILVPAFFDERFRVTERATMPG